MQTLDSQDPVAVAVTDAIRGGHLPELRRLLDRHPGLASARIVQEPREGCGGAGGRSLLHLATDWPGNFPNGPQVVALLVRAGADPDARFAGAHAETPLHWAAGSNDVAVLDALIEAGADIEATGGVIGAGTPLADACGFGQWEAAHRLRGHGARVTLEDAATLGLVGQVEEFLPGDEPPAADEVTSAFWGACHGGQLAVARLLHAHGADVDRIGHGGARPVDIAAAQGAEAVVRWLRELGAE
ncbi:ankyrin repeat domain-containing protein [Streptomyces sp. NBC_00390]|uniref:ankyrin repeat domain-containing protein n=1 Tax=Streptomyces sp. NBC_00390 TaxID=2975736 RepID=UPI002E1C7ED6